MTVLSFALQREAHVASDFPEVRMRQGQRLYLGPPVDKDAESHPRCFLTDIDLSPSGVKSFGPVMPVTLQIVQFQGVIITRARFSSIRSIPRLKDCWNSRNAHGPTDTRCKRRSTTNMATTRNDYAFIESQVVLPESRKALGGLLRLAWKLGHLEARISRSCG